MERIEIIIMSIFAIFAVGSTVFALISITKTDNTFDGKIVNTAGNNVSIKEWLETEEGVKGMGQAINKTTFLPDTISYLKNQYEVIKEKSIQIGDQTGSLPYAVHVLSSDPSKGGAPVGFCGNQHPGPQFAGQWGQFTFTEDYPNFNKTSEDCSSHPPYQTPWYETVSHYIVPWSNFWKSGSKKGGPCYLGS